MYPSLKDAVKGPVVDIPAAPEINPLALKLPLRLIGPTTFKEPDIVAEPVNGKPDVPPGVPVPAAVILESTDAENAANPTVSFKVISPLPVGILTVIGNPDGKFIPTRYLSAKILPVVYNAPLTKSEPVTIAGCVLPSYGNDAPPVPELPEEPANPDVPAEPVVPALPVLPDVPDVPFVPDVPAVPLVPAAPGPPFAPDVPDVPALPVEPDEPDCPGAPAVFTNQDVIDVPLPVAVVILTINSPVPLLYEVTLPSNLFEAF
jgi:hypothetical protein